MNRWKQFQYGILGVAAVFVPAQAIDDIPHDDIDGRVLAVRDALKSRQNLVDEKTEPHGRSSEEQFAQWGNTSNWPNWNNCTQNANCPR